MAKLGSISETLFDFAFKKSKTNKGNMPTVSEPDNNTELLEEERQNEDTTSSNKENTPTDMELLEEERRTDSTSSDSDSEIAEPSSKKFKPKHWPGDLSF